MLTTIVKQPRETLRPVPTFDTTAPIAAVLGVTVVARGLVTGAAAVTAAATVTAGVATLSLSGGSDGERYLVTTRVRDAAGAELESETEVAVIEATWALPDGGVPWLSIVDFVRKFGLDEVVRMTDATGAGRIDRDLLTGAMADAQAIAEAHLASRYALPLATVPPIVALAVADIARNRLYPRGAPEGVDTAAKAAMKSLENIRDGKLALAIDGVQPVAAASDAPVLIAPGRRQYPDSLADY